MSIATERKTRKRKADSKDVVEPASKRLKKARVPSGKSLRA
jgi:hypothetical protein